MIDRTTKVLWLAIAVGLWVNLIGTWLRPSPAHAQATTRQAVAFVDYWKLVQEQRERNVSADDIQILLLAHIAGNTTTPR
jgi:hypothetical protein